jgi:hypothetical protein
VSQCPQCRGSGSQEGSYWGRVHARQHRLWAQGIPLMQGIAEPNNRILVVPEHQTPLSFQRLAYRMAKVASKPAHAGAILFCPPSTRLFPCEEWTIYKRTAFLAVRDRHVVGLIVTFLILAQENPLRTPLRSISLAFVCGNYLRQHVATSLVLFAAQYFCLSPAEMGWCGPFTTAGSALAKRFSDILLV